MHVCMHMHVYMRMNMYNNTYDVYNVWIITRAICTICTIIQLHNKIGETRMIQICMRNIFCIHIYMRNPSRNNEQSRYSFHILFNVLFLVFVNFILINKKLLINNRFYLIKKRFVKRK